MGVGGRGEEKERERKRDLFARLDLFCAEGDGEDWVKGGRGMEVGGGEGG